MDRVLWFMYNYRIIITIAAALELLKMIYVICSSCCSCIKRPKAILVAILDLIFGVPGLAVIVIPILIAVVLPSDPTIVIADEEFTEKDLLTKVATPLVILSGLPTLTGLLTVFAVSCKNYCFTNTVILLRFIIILLWAGVIIIFTLFYINYYGDTDYSQTNILVFFQYIHFFFGAPGTFGITQMYFIYIVCDFRSHELKESMYAMPQPRMVDHHNQQHQQHHHLTGEDNELSVIHGHGQKVDV